MPETVLVSAKEYEKGKEVFAGSAAADFQPAPHEESALAEAVRTHGCRAVVLGVEPYTGPLYEALAAQPGPRLMARFGVGHDSIDKQWAAEHDILVANTPGVLDQSVAELTLWLLGALVRGVPALDTAMRKGAFPGPPAGGELCGRRLLLLGFGPIARRVALIAGHGLGMRVTGLGRRSLGELAETENLTPPAFLEKHALETYAANPAEALPEADVVSVHLPSNAQTHHYADADLFARMKRGAYFINTARGPIVDEAALYDALDEGRIAGAGLDVYAHEPYRPAAPDRDLRTLDNVVLTPHIGSNTHEANTRMANACVANVEHFLAGDYARITTVSGAPST